MSPADPKIIEKIHRLLSLSSSENEYEATTAISKAQEYLTRYKLTIEDVQLHGEFRDGIVHKEYHIDWLGRRQPFLWCVSLACAIAQGTYVKILQQPRYRTIIFIGRETDVDVTMDMFDWLHKEIYRLAVHASRNQDLANGKMKIHAYRFRTSFLDGCVSKIEKRFEQEQLDREAANCKVTAIVRRSDEENQAYINDVWKKLGKFQGSKRHNYSPAYRMGTKCANDLKLERPKGGMPSQQKRQLCASNE